MLERMQALLADVTYKPRSFFRVREGTFGNLWLTLTVWVPDVNNPASIVPIQTMHIVTETFIENRTDEEVLNTVVLGMIRKWEMHEANEWFKHKGKCVCDPSELHGA